MTRFREEQTFLSNWLLWAAFAVVGFNVARGFVTAEPAKWPSWTTVLIVGAGLLWIAAMRMVTEVRDDALRVKFKLLWPERLIPYGEIVKAEPMRYHPILDYGGWGVRGFGRVRAFNVSGTDGVLLKLRDGNDLMIGSRKANDLAAAIHERRSA